MIFEGKEFVRVFQEDECLKHDPTATRINDAFRGFLGVDMQDVKPDETRDDGDGFAYVFRDLGAIVHTSFDGSSLYIDKERLPHAALFGARWNFETWKRASDGLLAMRDPDPHGGVLHVLHQGPAWPPDLCPKRPRGRALPSRSGPLGE